MKLHILFGQRKEDYPGQYAPEALEVMDEYGYDENGEWLQNKLEEYWGHNEFVSLKIIEVDVGSTEALRGLLVGTPSIQGKVLTEPGSE